MMTVIFWQRSHHSSLFQIPLLQLAKVLGENQRSKPENEQGYRKSNSTLNIVSVEFNFQILSIASEVGGQDKVISANVHQMFYQGLNKANQQHAYYTHPLIVHGRNQCCTSPTLLLALYKISHYVCLSLNTQR